MPEGTQARPDKKSDMLIGAPPRGRCDDRLSTPDIRRDVDSARRVRSTLPLPCAHRTLSSPGPSIFDPATEDQHQLEESVKVHVHCIVAATTLIGLSIPFSAAHAQFANLLSQGSNSPSTGLRSFAGGGSSGGLGGLDNALSGDSVTSSNSSNVAGVLQFCIKNNYLGGNSASSVKNSLMSKLPGGASNSDSSYTDGTKGIVDTGNGQKLSLGGSVKQQLTRQICDKILDQGKSMQ